jgi:nucleoporin POM152
MNGTPRLRSAYPATPRSTGGRSRTERPPDDASSKSSHEHVWTSPAVTDSDGPLIPLSVIDAPTQRLYVSAFYIALTAWRLFDFWSIGSGDTESFWFFMKWVVIDGICLFGMPGLRIPWLEWSPTTMTLLFLCHAVLDIWLAFDAPVTTACEMQYSRMLTTADTARFHFRLACEKCMGQGIGCL